MKERGTEGSIYTKYIQKCQDTSDINEHLPTLYRYGLECSHITECGVRGVTSSYAFANALKNKENAKLVQIDLNTNYNVIQFQQECIQEGICNVFYQESDLTCPIDSTELLFIDTWHVYGHLKRELARWHSYVSKYIILHDTTVDEWVGETLRNKWNPNQQSKETGIPVEEIVKGMWPAIDEFLNDHPEWYIKERFTNNNGLTILTKHSQQMIVGDYTYGHQHIRLKSWGENTILKIGKFCSIADNVTVFLGGNHRVDWISTYPFGHINGDVFTTFNGYGHPSTNGNVIIGNDVWISSGVTIMSGIKIGDGAIIAANSHVVKNVEPYSLVGGNPAKLIRYRFPSEHIDALLNISWWNWDIRKINDELVTICSKDIQIFIDKQLIK